MLDTLLVIVELGSMVGITLFILIRVAGAL